MHRRSCLSVSLSCYVNLTVVVSHALALNLSFSQTTRVLYSSNIVWLLSLIQQTFCPPSPLISFSSHSRTSIPSGIFQSLTFLFTPFFSLRILIALSSYDSFLLLIHVIFCVIRHQLKYIMAIKVQTSFPTLIPDKRITVDFKIRVS